MLSRTSGAGLRRSICVNTAISARPAASSPIVRPEPQPKDWALTIANTSTTRPEVTVTAPARSNVRWVDSTLDSGMKRSVSASVASPDRDVDDEDPRPRGELGEHAAEEQADRAAAGGDRAPDAERLGALILPGECRRDDRERRGGDEGAAEPLERPAGDQHSGRLREAVEQRGGAEHDDPGREQPLTTEQVGRAAAEQQEAAEDERVRVDDPLEVRGGEVQPVLNGGQRDVHDGRIEHDHELGEAGDHEDQPPICASAGWGGQFRPGRGLCGCGHARSFVNWNSAVRLTVP